ncbi:thiamine pyrophosphate-dependent enzyme [Bacillus licheniformis]|nr:thiamine pyrophosphate-dependent enzyme [Bacillus licheniformis]
MDGTPFNMTNQDFDIKLAWHDGMRSSRRDFCKAFPSGTPGCSRMRRRRFQHVYARFPTAVKYELPIVVVILNNQNLGMIQYEQQEKGMLIMRRRSKRRLCQVCRSLRREGLQRDKARRAYSCFESAFHSQSRRLSMWQLKTNRLFRENILYTSCKLQQIYDQKLVEKKSSTCRR